MSRYWYSRRKPNNTEKLVEVDYEELCDLTGIGGSEVIMMPLLLLFWRGRNLLKVSRCLSSSRLASGQVHEILAI